MESQHKLAWCMFYSSIVGWQYHPGTTHRLPTVICAELADEMLKHYLKREAQWDGQSQHK